MTGLEVAQQTGTETFGSKSLLSLDGSSLDEVVANLPIENGPTQSSDFKAEEHSTS